MSQRACVESATARTQFLPDLDDGTLTYAGMANDMQDHQCHEGGQRPRDSIDKFRVKQIRLVHSQYETPPRVFEIVHLGNPR
jgi:hypothetical protein